MAEGDAVSGIVDSSKETFTKKLGPAPVWAWAALGLGVLFLVSRNRKRSSVSSAASGSAPSDTWMPSTAVMPNGYVPSTDETSVAPTIYTNDDWIVEAARKLSATHTDNTQVLKRLRQYVNGGSYAQGEFDATVAAAEEAIKAVGPPPEAVGFLQVQGTAPLPMPAPNLPTPNIGSTEIPLQPAPTTAPNNGQVQHFRVDTFGDIYGAAEHYFGDRNAWNLFYIDPGSSGNPKGWINSESVKNVSGDWILAVGPEGRIRD